jgi:hypothetical protein
MTFLTENEFAALYVPARYIPRIHPNYREVVEVLAMQLVDEARHAELHAARRSRRCGPGDYRDQRAAVSEDAARRTRLYDGDVSALRNG